MLVEDEDGFEIPMPRSTEVVVVEQDDYADGQDDLCQDGCLSRRLKSMPTPQLHQDSRSIKAILNEHENDVDMNVEE